MKVLVHAKEQTRKSKDALLAHSQMVFALKRVQKLAKQDLENKRLRRAMAAVRARPMYYRLNPDKSVTPIPGRLGDNSAMLEWGREFEKFENRIVAQDYVDGRLVSTVFLGQDHGYSDSGPPILFETMAFSNETKTFKWKNHERQYHEELDICRYSTWDEAVAGHARILAETRAIVAKINAVTKPGDAE